MDADTSSELDHESSLFLTTLLVPGEAASILGHSHCCTHTHTHTLKHVVLHPVMGGYTWSFEDIQTHHEMFKCECASGWHTEIESAAYLCPSVPQSFSQNLLFTQRSLLCSDMSHLNFLLFSFFPFSPSSSSSCNFHQNVGPVNILVSMLCAHRNYDCHCVTASSSSNCKTRHLNRQKLSSRCIIMSPTATNSAQWINLQWC